MYGAVFPGIQAVESYRPRRMGAAGPFTGAHAGAAAQNPVGRDPRQMKKAVVLLSGGLDSATVLAIARSEGYECYCLSVDYGQRHRAELGAAARVANSLGAREHRVVTLDLTVFGGSALTDASIPVPV